MQETENDIEIAKILGRSIESIKKFKEKSFKPEIKLEKTENDDIDITNDILPTRFKFLQNFSLLFKSIFFDYKIIVIEGDIVEINKEKYAMQGIDADDNTTINGRNSTKHLKKLIIKAKKIFLTKRISEFTNEISLFTEDNICINKQMVRDGYAASKDDYFSKEEILAKKEKLGWWKNIEYLDQSNIKPTKFSFWFNIKFIFFHKLSKNVKKVNDADGIIYGNDEQIRMLYIDAPEYDQSYGKEAKYHLKKLLFDKKIEIERHGACSYGRTLAIVYADSKNINRQLVVDGFAWATVDFEKNKKPFSEEEKFAKLNRLGLWQEDNPTPPWNAESRNKEN